MVDVIYKPRTVETSATTGTGPLTLAGAPTGTQTFGDGVGDGNGCHFITAMGSDWEWSSGVYTSSGTTVTRAKTYRSTNSDAAVNWAAGTKVVFTFDPHNLWGGQIAKTANYTAAQEDRTILCDATGGAFTISLPAAADYQGKQFVIVKTDSSGNAITIDPNASETINGSSTASLASQFDALTVESDGSNWLKVGDPAGSSDAGIYALLAGRSGGQTLRGGTDASDNLILRSTSNATKGDIVLADEGGNVKLGGGATASELRLLEPSGSGTNYTAFKAQAQVGDVTYTLPAADGSASEFLQTDGAGALSWAAGGGLVATAVKTANYTAAAGELVRCDVNTTGSFTVTFPASPAANDRIGVILTVGSAAKTVTISGNGKTLEGNHDSKLYREDDLLIFQYDGTEWQTIEDGLQPHQASMYDSNQQSMTNGAFTKLPFNTENYDYGGIADPTTNHRFDILRPGRYDVEGHWSINVYGYPKLIIAAIYVNGSLVCRVDLHSSHASANGVMVNKTLDLAAGDYIELFGFQNAGTYSSYNLGGREARMTVTEQR